MRSSQTTELASSYHLLKGAPLNAAAMIYWKAVSFVAGIILAGAIGATQYGIFNVGEISWKAASSLLPSGLILLCSAISEPRRSGFGPDSHN